MCLFQLSQYYVFCRSTPSSSLLPTSAAHYPLRSLFPPHLTLLILASIGYSILSIAVSHPQSHSTLHSLIASVAILRSACTFIGRCLHHVACSLYALDRRTFHLATPLRQRLATRPFHALPFPFPFHVSLAFALHTASCTRGTITFSINNIIPRSTALTGIVRWYMSIKSLVTASSPSYRTDNSLDAPNVQPSLRDDPQLHEYGFRGRDRLRCRHPNPPEGLGDASLLPAPSQPSATDRAHPR